MKKTGKFLRLKKRKSLTKRRSKKTLKRIQGGDKKRKLTDAEIDVDVNPHLKQKRPREELVDLDDVKTLRNAIKKYRFATHQSYLDDSFLSHLPAFMIKPTGTYTLPFFRYRLVDEIPDTMTKSYLSDIYKNMNNVKNGNFKSRSYQSDEVIYKMIILRDTKHLEEREDPLSEEFHDGQYMSHSERSSHASAESV